MNVTWLRLDPACGAPLANSVKSSTRKEIFSATGSCTPGEPADEAARVQIEGLVLGGERRVQEGPRGREGRVEHLDKHGERVKKILFDTVLSISDTF